MTIERYGSEIIFNNDFGRVEKMPSHNDIIDSPEKIRLEFKELVVENNGTVRVIVHPFYGLHSFGGEKISEFTTEGQRKYLDALIKLISGITKENFPFVLFETANGIDSFEKICQSEGAEINLSAANIMVIPTHFNSPTPFMDGDVVEDGLDAAGNKGKGDLLGLTEILREDYDVAQALVGGQQFYYGRQWHRGYPPDGYTNQPFVANTGKERGTEQEISGCVAVVIDALRSVGIEVKVSNITSY